MKYKICPRCELNYIIEEENYCNVCKAELGLVERIFYFPMKTRKTKTTALRSKNYYH